MRELAAPPSTASCPHCAKLTSSSPSLPLFPRRVSDLRQFVVAARPAMAAREFVLMTTFPNKELTDESSTLQQSGLLNAVIVQRLK